MPRGDGTGPTGQGPGAGRKMGSGCGQGKGKKGGSFAAGSCGNCICTTCGYSIPHSVGQPCNQTICPKCGVNMTRA